MAESLTEPDVITQPFAQNGDKNTIPATNDPATGLASLAYGFPPITSVRLDNGGKAPRRADVNGAINLISQQNFFAQNGGTNTFRQAVSDAIGGYPLNARLTYTDPNGNSVILRSNKANNSDNFVSNTSFIGTSWIPESPALSWNNTWTGNNTFSGSLNATTPTSATDHSTNVSTTQWFRNAITNLGVQHLTKYEDIGDLPYTAPIDGIMRVRIGATYNWELYINGIIVQQQNRNDSDSCTTTWVTIPVKQGDVLTKGSGTIHNKEMYYPY